MSPRLSTARRRASRDEDRVVRAVLTGAASAAEAPPSDHPDTTAAAFFDVDNTLMMGASIYHFARGLAARQLFTSRDLARFAYQQLRFRVGGTEDPQRMRRVRESALAFVSGRTVAEIVRYCEEIFDETMDARIWPGTRSLARQHIDAGQPVWLVTATPYELANIIAQRLGLTGALGTVAEVDEGTFTGRLVGEPLHGPAKAEAVRALAARDGLDLARCTAYSDSANDLPMLRLVGHAVAINPDPELRRVAKEEGWTIRDFRTGRKAARIAAATGLATGVAGSLALGLGALRRRRH